MRTGKQCHMGKKAGHSDSFIHLITLGCIKIPRNLKFLGDVAHM